VRTAWLTIYLSEKEYIDFSKGSPAMSRTATLSKCFLLTACVVAPGIASQVAAEQPALAKKTYIFKTVGETQIQADVYRADDTRIRPVVVWFHGGALIVGSRGSVPKQLLGLCREEGYALVSFDYRLAPEARLPAIVEDVEDAFRWLQAEGPKQLFVDPDRFVVAGGSAGGYLTLLTGYRIKPRPRALVAYWGYGDINGDWYTKPSEHYRKQSLVDKDEAYRAVGGKVTTGTGGAEGRARGRYYLYLRQNGLWTREVSGYDPTTEEGHRKLEPFCPIRNVTAGYPPTMLIHGTTDTDVPYEQSAEMAKELARQKITHELVTVPGAGHGLSGGDKKLVEAANDRALAFIREHLK
jgi:acetyl esterase/lipase